VHTLTIRTKFTFGDHVRFDSHAQGCSGIGTVFAITVDKDGNVDYIVERDGHSQLQAGILENEATLLTDHGTCRDNGGIQDAQGQSK
jgi:hypothetical protein